MLSARDIQQRFLRFFTEDPRNHKRIPNVSLVPHNDPSLLFVNSGMFPLVPYLSGEPHPLGKRLCNFQRSIRTMAEDLEEIGDARHTTCFNMMGNWSLGDFWKHDQIPWIAELYINEFGLDINRFFVSVFRGDEDAPRDDDAIEIWKRVFKTYGIEALVSDDPTDVMKNYDDNGNLLPDQTTSYRIFAYEKKKNWWQRGHAAGELGGPSSEMFYDCGAPLEGEYKNAYHINDDSGKFIEVGNNVFMEYYLDEGLKWQKLKQRNIDFGGGFERVVFCSHNKMDIFDTELYLPAIEVVEKLSGLKYYELSETAKKPFRVIVDHIRAATFIMGDEVLPSNKEQGYILRRFIRRAINFGRKLNLQKGFTAEVGSRFVDILSQFDDYAFLKDKKEMIMAEMLKEEEKFHRTLAQGIRELDKYLSKAASSSASTEPESSNHPASSADSPRRGGGNDTVITGEQAFYIYETYGFPFDLIVDELLSRNIPFDKNQLEAAFKESMQKHRAQSNAGAEHVFKGGLADTKIETTRLHTTHHILLATLRKILGPHVHQRGSNITAERLRIDFSHTEKMTPEQLQLTEDMVNEVISKDYNMVRREMKFDDAVNEGAEMEFGQKYGDVVSVYFLEDAEGNAFSKEFCGGPHVQHTSQIREGGRFKIMKEEAVGSGVRRIKGVLLK